MKSQEQDANKNKQPNQPNQNQKEQDKNWQNPKKDGGCSTCK